MNYHNGKKEEGYDVRSHISALVALPVVAFALETGIAGFFTLFHPAKEVLIGGTKSGRTACKDVQSTSFSQGSSCLSAVSPLSCRNRVGAFPVFCIAPVSGRESG